MALTRSCGDARAYHSADDIGKYLIQCRTARLTDVLIQVLGEWHRFLSQRLERGPGNYRPTLDRRSRPGWDPLATPSPMPTAGSCIHAYMNVLPGLGAKAGAA